MGTKAAITAARNADRHALDQLHRKVHADLLDQAQVLCCVCEHFVIKKYCSVGELDVCWECAKNNGEKLARLLWYINHTVALAPCESETRAAIDNVYDIACKCQPCTLRRLLRAEPTTYGDYRNLGTEQHRGNH